MASAGGRLYVVQAGVPSSFAGGKMWSQDPASPLWQEVAETIALSAPTPPSMRVSYEKAMKWIPSTAAPKRRFYHSMAGVGGKLFMYGDADYPSLLSFDPEVLLQMSRNHTHARSLSLTPTLSLCPTLSFLPLSLSSSLQPTLSLCRCPTTQPPPLPHTFSHLHTHSRVPPPPPVGGKSQMLNLEAEDRLDGVQRNRRRTTRIKPKPGTSGYKT